MPIREIISSYSQPIIMGLTPYTKASVTVPGQRSDWPPTRDEERLASYEDFTALVENRPVDIFPDLRARDDQTSKIALALALPELLCNVWADAVWTDPPQIDLPSAQADERWQAIDEANDFSEIVAWESVFATAAWGHSILKLRRDEARLDQFDSDVVIEEIDAGIFFPVMKRGSSREIDYIVLAWEEDRATIDDDHADIWQVRELHTVDDGQYRIRRQERKPAGLLGTNAWRQVGDEAPEGVDFLPFVDMHAKRWRGRYWGVSELTRIFSLVDEIDNTLSNIAEILEYHGKPMLQVPASTIYGGIFTKGADRTMGIRRPEEADIARYITYDGQIDSQLADLDRLLELTLLTCEVPRTYFGIGAEASAPASGVSLKLQLQNYLKKATRYQRNESLRLRALVPMALKLDGKISFGKMRDMLPEITNGSPLPADDEQDARIEQGLYGAGMTSLKLSLKKLRRVPSDQIDDELKAIEDEKAASVAALPDPLRQNASGSPVPPVDGSGRPGNSSTDPNAGDGPPA